MIEMRIEIPRGDQPCDSWRPELAERFDRLPVRLGQDRYSISTSFEQATDHGIGKGGVVDIGVSGDQHEVDSMTDRIIGLSCSGKPALLDAFLHRHR